MRPASDQGYAIVAAVAALAVFATLAYAVLAADRGALDDLRAQYAQARLDAAAEAGLAKAIEGLASADPQRRWPIDGRLSKLVFEGTQLTIRIEDERGKVPMTDLTDEQVRRLFFGAGARGAQLDTLTDSFLDWVDEDDDRRPHGAEAPDYLAQGVHPRNGAPLTIEELARLNGMTPEIFERIRPVLTTHFGQSGAFGTCPATYSQRRGLRRYLTFFRAAVRSISGSIISSETWTFGPCDAQ